MEFGTMDKRIALQSNVETRLDNGEISDGYQTYAEVWAEKRELAAREINTSGMEQAQEKVIWIVRWTSSIEENHCVLHDGKRYDIERIREIGRKRRLELNTVLHRG